MDYYKEMYYILFNKITDIISELQALQSKTEELFIIQQEDKVLQLVSNDTKSNTCEKNNNKFYK